MTNLRKADLKNTPCDVSAIQALAKVRPDLTIYWDGGTITGSVATSSGTAAFEMSPMDPKAVYSIDGSEYRRSDLDRSIQLPVGEHKVIVTLGNRKLLSESFDIIANQRKIVSLIDPDRRAAQKVLELGGSVGMLINGQPQDVTAIEKLPKEPFAIDAINLWGNENLRDDDLKLFANLDALRTFGISGTQVTDAGILHLHGKLKLAQLDVTRTKISDPGLDALLSTIPNLNHLLFGGLPVTDRIMARVAGYSLSLFEAGETKIGDNGVLHLRGKQFWTCNLEGTPITDQGLKNMEGCGFDHLVLSGTGITDAGLEHCKKFTNLGTINLRSTKVTEAGVVMLQKAFPNCKIER